MEGMKTTLGLNVGADPRTQLNPAQFWNFHSGAAPGDGGGTRARAACSSGLAAFLNNGSSAWSWRRKPS